MIDQAYRVQVLEVVERRHGEGWISQSASILIDLCALDGGAGGKVIQGKAVWKENEQKTILSLQNFQSSPKSLKSAALPMWRANEDKFSCFLAVVSEGLLGHQIAEVTSKEAAARGQSVTQGHDALGIHIVTRGWIGEDHGQMGAPVIPLDVSHQLQHRATQLRAWKSWFVSKYQCSH